MKLAPPTVAEIEAKLDELLIWALASHRPAGPLAEAQRASIHPFCITIDSEARDYLPHMYGAVNWALVEDVKKLPLKVSDIYRRLTA